MFKNHKTSRKRSFPRGKRSRRGKIFPAGNQLRPKRTSAKTKGNRSAEALAAKATKTQKRAVGVFMAHERGFGFVKISDEAPDIFIPASRVGEALHGDQVEVLIHEGGRRRDPRAWGEIVKVLARSQKPLIGRFTGEFIVPHDPRLQVWPRVHPAEAGSAQPGETVVAELVRWPMGRLPASARVVEVLGDENDPLLESRITLRAHGFREEFPEEVMALMTRLPRQVRKTELAGRTDLRSLLTITIDPETARDFDDALAIAREKHGFRVWVSIADVSHYVTAGSALDREAYNRGTSVYFPDRAIPMLPPQLSAGLCSLKPHEDRLAITVEMAFDEGGKRLSASFYPSVIRSDFRLTYDQVEQMEKDDELREKFSPLWPTITLLRELAQKRRRRRFARGALDLDLPEPEVILDEKGEVTTILRREQTWSHQLVEEFMLAANEAVAEFLTHRHQPLLYRIHQPPRPSSVLALADLLAPLGFQLLGPDSEPEHIRPRDYQRVLRQAKGSPYEMMVKVLCLRSMMQAEYAAENYGHFGLASECYCHFTSPIRRYPDLVVHRALKILLGLSEPLLPLAAEELETAATHASERERAAEEAEREMVELYRCRWMEKHLGEEFRGVISGVTAFGLFVELDQPFLEGLVPLEFLEEETEFREKEMALREPKSKRLFQLGDAVRVRAAGVDLSRRRIYFSLREKI